MSFLDCMEAAAVVKTAISSSKLTVGEYFVINAITRCSTRYGCKILFHLANDVDVFMPSSYNTTITDDVISKFVSGEWEICFKGYKQYGSYQKAEFDVRPISKNKN